MAKVTITKATIFIMKDVSGLNYVRYKKDAWYAEIGDLIIPVDDPEELKDLEERFQVETHGNNML